jgi:tRNA-splicing ligase RtcB (3'-phosphate/5'-hydroxy nucleic acid ligase)
MRIVGDDIPVWGDPIDEEAVRQIINCRRTADWVAMMADHHKGYAVPIGGVVAYRNSISPSGVGYDIACGNKAVLTDANLEDVKANIETIMDDVYSNISFGVGQKNSTAVDHDLFYGDVWKLRAVSGLRDMARHQLGTVGSGNHYVDIFEDELGRVWVGVHFGSRGLGHKTATFFLEAGGAKDEMDAMPLVIPVSSPLGEEYIECMNLAGKYAYAGRDWVCSKVVEDILGATILAEVHNHHNFAWPENHQGEDLWVVRKGATPAFPGQLGFVGGSMGDISVILEGKEESEESAYSLSSTIHGAGRVMSRTQAAGKMNYKTRSRSGGQVSKEMMMEWVNGFGVTLRGADTDESPQAYKRLPEVLKHHENSIRVLHTLKPLGVAMAGRDVVDPYKD